MVLAVLDTIRLQIILLEVLSCGPWASRHSLGGDGTTRFSLNRNILHFCLLCWALGLLPETGQGDELEESEAMCR